VNSNFQPSDSLQAFRKLIRELQNRHAQHKAG
jgi:hypothetical protein